MVGTLLVRRRYRVSDGPSIRIHKRSGTKDRKVLKQMHAVLDKLYSQGRLDLLREIREGGLSIQELYSSGLAEKGFRTSADLKQLGDGSLFTDWLTTHPIDKKMKQDYGNLFKAVLRFARADETLSDLPVIGQRAREWYAAESKLTMFNRLRAAVRPS